MLTPVLSQAEMASEVSSERHSGAVLGGYKEIKSDNPEALEAADFAVEQLSQQLNSLVQLKLRQVGCHLLCIASH